MTIRLVDVEEIRTNLHRLTWSNGRTTEVTDTGLEAAWRREAKFTRTDPPDAA